MSDTRADAWNHLIWIVLLATGISVAPLEKFNLPKLEQHVESALVYFLASIATLTHVHYGYGVVS